MRRATTLLSSPAMAPAPSIVSRFGQWLNRSWRLPTGTASPPDPRHELGRRGEALAARWLRRKGYKVLYRNFRPPRGGGEVDLVCRYGQTLVFVEVKTRSSVTFGRPADAVDAAKQELICRGARVWLKLLKLPDISFRFDIVEVVVEPGKAPVCNVIEGAFSLPD